jgi:hypothetical protein
VTNILRRCRADPNICSRTTPQHPNITLVYSFNLKCIVYKSKKKGNNFQNFISCIYFAVYIKLDPTHAWHSHISDLHIIISLLMQCWTIWKKKRRDKIHCKLMYNILVYNEYLHVQLLYPLQTKFGGVYRNHPVRPSMYIVPCKHN